MCLGGYDDTIVWGFDIHYLFTAIYFKFCRWGRGFESHRTNAWLKALDGNFFLFLSYAEHRRRDARTSATGTRTRVARVRAEYPNQLDYSGDVLTKRNYVECIIGAGVLLFRMIGDYQNRLWCLGEPKIAGSSPARINWPALWILLGWQTCHTHLSTHVRSLGGSNSWPWG